MMRMGQDVHSREGGRETGFGGGVGAFNISDNFCCGFLLRGKRRRQNEQLDLEVGCGQGRFLPSFEQHSQFDFTRPTTKLPFSPTDRREEEQYRVSEHFMDPSLVESSLFIIWAAVCR